MIDTILIDYGGVISIEGSQRQWVEDNYKKYGKTPDELWEIILSKWKDAKVNTISSSEYWQYIGDTLGVSADDIRTEISRTFHINTEMVALLDELSRKYTLVLTSNQIEDWLEEVLDMNDLRKYFKHNFSSYVIRLSKPDPEYFAYIEQKLGKDASSLLLIDDQMKNIDGAKACGVEAIQFTSVKQVRIELLNLGIQISSQLHSS